MSKKKRILLCCIPPALGLLALLFRDVFVYIASFFHTCEFLAATGFYCPGCGHTRSVLALLQLDILTALAYNPAPLFAALIAALGYGELLTWAAGKHRPLVPRSGWFWAVCGILFALYYIARNFFQCLTILPV